MHSIRHIGSIIFLALLGFSLVAPAAVAAAPDVAPEQMSGLVMQQEGGEEMANAGAGAAITMAIIGIAIVVVLVVVIIAAVSLGIIGIGAASIQEDG